MSYFEVGTLSANKLALTEVRTSTVHAYLTSCIKLEHFMDAQNNTNKCNYLATICISLVCNYTCIANVYRV